MTLDCLRGSRQPEHVVGRVVEQLNGVRQWRIESAACGVLWHTAHHVLLACRPLLREAGRRSRRCGDLDDCVAAGGRALVTIHVLPDQCNSLSFCMFSDGMPLQLLDERIAGARCVLVSDHVRRRTIDPCQTLLKSLVFRIIRRTRVQHNRADDSAVDSMQRQPTVRPLKQTSELVQHRSCSLCDGLNVLAERHLRVKVNAEILQIRDFFNWEAIDGDRVEIAWPLWIDTSVISSTILICLYHAEESQMKR